MTDFVSIRGAFFPLNQIKQITQHREDNTNTFRVETQEYLVEEAVPPTQFTVIPNQHQHLHLAEFSWEGKQCETELFPILAWRVKVNLFPYSDGREEYGVGEPITVAGQSE